MFSVQDFCFLTDTVSSRQWQQVHWWWKNFTGYLLQLVTRSWFLLFPEVVETGQCRSLQKSVGRNVQREETGAYSWSVTTWSQQVLSRVEIACQPQLPRAQEAETWARSFAVNFEQEQPGTLFRGPEMESLPHPNSLSEQAKSSFSSLRHYSFSVKQKKYVFLWFIAIWYRFLYF